MQHHASSVRDLCSIDMNLDLLKPLYDAIVIKSLVTFVTLMCTLKMVKRFWDEKIFHDFSELILSYSIKSIQ